MVEKRFPEAEDAPYEQNMEKKIKKISSGEIAANGTAHISVKPWGNYIIDKQNGVREIRSSGLGLFSRLSDEFLQEFILNYILFPTEVTYLQTENGFRQQLFTLSTLSRCSRAFYVYTYHDSLWRDITIRYFGGSWSGFKQSWRSTFKQRYNLSVIPDVPIIVQNMYSDFLFASYHGANTPIHTLCDVKLTSTGEIDITKDTITRVSGISSKEFKLQFSERNLPCIITDIVPKWKAFTEWNMQSLARRFGTQTFRAEAVDLPLEEYVTYSSRIESKEFTEESPLYLFDKYFGDRCPSLAQEYSVPEYFSQDLFQFIGKDEGGSVRPDYRWIIIGPTRSGSTFHVDPNSTSAWNAVISGAKKWILFPPGMIPPGVFVNKDMSEVTSAQTLAEWYIHYYKQAKKQFECFANYPETQRPLFGTCRAGEVMFVPNGWWHCVMNLSESIAITQNYVDDCNLSNVLRFLRDKPDQVSGVDNPKELFDMFVKALRNQQPKVLEEMQNREALSNRKWSWEPIAEKESMWSCHGPTGSTRERFAFKFSS